MTKRALPQASTELSNRHFEKYPRTKFRLGMGTSKQRIPCGSHFSEISVKLAEKNEFGTHSIQRCLEMCKNNNKPNVSFPMISNKKSSTSDHS